MDWIITVYIIGAIATALYAKLKMDNSALSSILVGLIWPLTVVFLLAFSIMFDIFVEMISPPKPPKR